MIDSVEFYNRKVELEDLKGLYKELDSGQLCILYGRRRLGKTLFIKEFINQTKGDSIYYFVNKANKTELLKLLSDNIYDQTGEREKFYEWEDFFGYLLRKSQEKKLIFIMDEFSRLKENSPSFLTKFQNFWDEKLRHSKIMFIAIGSSMSMMHDIFMHKDAPMYGRMTLKISFKPFRYVDFREMFSDLKEEKKVELYAIFGGTPHFLWFVKKHLDKDLPGIISKLILSRTAPLRDEPTNFITMELKKETNYNSILYAIAKTNGSKQEIINHSGVDQKDIDYYLNNLIDLLCIVKKFTPLFYTKGNKTRYKFTDNYFHFWYKYIFPNLSLIELGNKKLLKKKIEKDINTHMGYKFEDIIRELLILYNSKKIKGLEIDFDEIGPWWGKSREGKTEEIDIVTNNKSTRKIIVCETKWRNTPTDIKEIIKLDSRAKLIKAAGTIKYLFVSKSGFTTECKKFMDQKNITHLDLKEIEELFDKAL